MTKRILSIALISALGLGFAGCGKNTPLVPKKLNTGNNITINKTFTYVDSLSNNPITKEDFVNSFVRNFDSKLNYKKFQFYKCNNYSFCRVIGKEVKYNNNILNVYYVKGVAYKKDYNKILDINNNEIVRSIAQFKIPLEVKNNNNKLLVFAKYPKSFDNFEYGKLGFTNYPAMDKIENLKKDSLDSFNKIKNLPIVRNYKLKGEVNSKYDTASINGNFKRLVPYKFQGIGIIYPKFINSLEKSYFNSLWRNNPYMIEYKKGIYPINYTIYPYRGGSKVTYTMDLNYKLYPNGTSSLTKEDLEGLKNKVENIINN
jgi:hypothetical protein